jgi:predicted phosphodiesterase
MIDTLIISDIHMGYATSQADNAQQLLETTPSLRTIVLGDLWTDGNVLGTQWGLIKTLRKRLGVVYIAGNHDPFLMSLIPAMFDEPCQWTYSWESYGQRCVAIHGHQYDTAVEGDPELAKILTESFAYASEKGWVGAEAERWFDITQLRWTREEPKVEAGVFELAKTAGANFCFAGHTHNPKTLTKDGIYYYNTGCWLGKIMTYVMIDETGTTLNYFKED